MSVQYWYFEGKIWYFTDTVPYRYRKCQKVNTVSGTEKIRDRDGILYQLLIPTANYGVKFVVSRKLVWWFSECVSSLLKMIFQFHHGFVITRISFITGCNDRSHARYFH